MQKFGLDSLQSGKPTLLELEIATEKASALGLTGAKLERSISSFRQAFEQGRSILDLEHLIVQVADDVTALLVQRELLGFVHENMEWALQAYDLPGAVIAKLRLVRK